MCFAGVYFITSGRADGSPELDEEGGVQELTLRKKFFNLICPSKLYSCQVFCCMCIILLDHNSSGKTAHFPIFFMYFLGEPTRQNLIV